jgi:hypothetical protein
MEWTDLAQNTDKWRALVITVTTVRVTQNPGEFLDKLRTC